MLTQNNKTNIFISKAIKIHGNKYDYSNVNYINAKTKINIMLVDSKFYFISLPRCASTSFLVNCLKQGIPVKHGNFTTDVMISKANWDVMKM